MSPDVLMLLEKIQEIAVTQGETATNVKLLRDDWTASKKTFATCDDLDRVEKTVNDHFNEHRESKRWTIGNLVAIVAAGGGLIGGIAAWIQTSGAIHSVPKGHP
jgi:hypothetical protein